jgi:hypothetical protein
VCIGVGLGFELKAWCLQSRYSTAWAILIVQSKFSDFLFHSDYDFCCEILTGANCNIFFFPYLMLTGTRGNNVTHRGVLFSKPSSRNGSKNSIFRYFLAKYRLSWYNTNSPLVITIWGRVVNIKAILRSSVVHWKRMLPWDLESRVCSVPNLASDLLGGLEWLT